MVCFIRGLTLIRMGPVLLSAAFSGGAGWSVAVSVISITSGGPSISSSIIAITVTALNVSISIRDVSARVVGQLSDDDMGLKATEGA